MATNEGRVYFSLDGDDFEPDVITELLGIVPTSVMIKGSKIPNKLPAKNSWELSTDNVVNDYIEVFSMAESIVDILMPIKDKLKEVIATYNLVPRLEVVLWFSTNEEHSTPAIGFEPSEGTFTIGDGNYLQAD